MNCNCFEEDQYGLAGVLRQLHAGRGETFVFIIDEWDCARRSCRSISGP
ncbi:MAG: hypothetical protein HFH93_02445 [Lachnospiraceae bacterium]|nr:hypothetical protein [Lachnospiraceae bacterium]